MQSVLLNTAAQVVTEFEKSDLLIGLFFVL